MHRRRFDILLLRSFPEQLNPFFGIFIQSSKLVFNPHSHTEKFSQHLQTCHLFVT